MWIVTFYSICELLNKTNLNTEYNLTLWTWLFRSKKYQTKIRKFLISQGLLRKFLDLFKLRNGIVIELRKLRVCSFTFINRQSGVYFEFKHVIYSNVEKYFVTKYVGIINPSSTWNHGQSKDVSESALINHQMFRK